MWLSWLNRLAERPELRLIGNWPQIAISEFDSEKKRTFLRNMRIVAQALDGKKLSTIAKENNLNKSRISVILTRALAGDESETPFLSQALVPQSRLKKANRRMDLGTFSKPAGSKGAFTYLLNNVPQLRERLDLMIKSSVNRLPVAQNITPKIFHSEFIRLLHQANWPSDVYPYTEASQGYETLRCYLREKKAEFSQVSIPKRTIQGKTHQLRACREIQIDEHSIDLIERADIVLNENLIPLRLARCKLILAVDSATNCNLGYRLVLSEKVTQFDMLSLLESISRQWEPMELVTPSLQYTPGACLPSYYGSEFLRLGFGIVRLDNALVHLAETVKDHICRNLSATLNLGLPGHPKGRSQIEHAIKLTANIAHRFPSTTGSHPKDPIRETLRNSKKAPTITLRGFEEILSVTLTHHNVLPQASLGNESPLAVLRYQMANMPLRLLPVEALAAKNPFSYSAVIPIKRITSERRRAHINFQYQRYVGDALGRNSFEHKKIRIECDYRDIRRLKVFSLSGDFLGEVHVQGGWMRFPHSIDTRKRIYKQNKKSRLSVRDPLGGYFAYLLEKRDSPSAALELMRISREFGFYNVESLGHEKVSRQVKELTDRISPNSDSRISAWYAAMFNGDDK